MLVLVAAPRHGAGVKRARRVDTHRIRDYTRTVLSIAPQDAAILAQGALVGQVWRPMKVHHSIPLLSKEATRVADMCEAIAGVQVSFEVQRLAVSSGDPPSHDAEPVLRSMLEHCRRVARELERINVRLVPDVARYHPRLARRLIEQADAAAFNMKELRALLANAVAEDDDVDLGYEFVPAPPDDLAPSGTVSFDIPGAREPGDCELTFTEAAAAQLTIMRARADAHASTPYKTHWDGVCVILRDMHNSAVFTGGDADSPDISVPVPCMKVGKTRIFFVVSIERKRVTVLLLTGERDNWNALAALRRRLEGAEWEPVFEELGSYIRPSARGLQMMKRVLESRDSRSQDEATLLARLSLVEPNDPVHVEGLFDVLHKTAEDAEDLIDAEDVSSSTDEPLVTWDAVRAEFE